MQHTTDRRLLPYWIMVSNEMIHEGRPSFPARLSTPPNSPDLQPSLSFILNDVKQLIAMLSAMAAMQIASTTPAQHRRCFHTPPESPSLRESSPVTFENPERLLLRVIQAASKSPDPADA